MPAPHRIAHLHALGGKYAQEAETELREALNRYGTVAKTARALGTSDKSVWRWLCSWGLTPPSKEAPVASETKKPSKGTTKKKT